MSDKNQLTDRSDRLLPGLEELDAVLDHLRASVEVLKAGYLWLIFFSLGSTKHN